MNSNLRILKNIIFILLSKFVDPLFSLILVLTIAKNLGVEGFGQYAFIKATFTIFVVIANLGLDQFVTREIARDKKQTLTYLMNFGILEVGFAALMAIVMSLFVCLSDYPQQVATATVIMSSALIYVALSNLAHAVIAAFERFELNTLLISGENLIRVILGTITLMLGYGLVPFIIVITITRFIGFLVSIRLVHKKITPLKWNFQLKFILQSLKKIPTFSLISIFSILYWRIDVIMLSKFGSLTEVGIYTAAFRLMEIIKAIPLSLKQALFPVNVWKYEKENSTFKEMINKSNKYLMIFLLPIAFIITMAAEKIIPIFYSSEFNGAINALKILIWTIVPYSLAMMLANVLVASRNQRVDMWTNIFGACANVVLNLILIPMYGVTGASIATLVSIILFIAFQVIYIRRKMFKLSLLSIILKPSIAVISMGVLNYTLNNLPLLGRISLSLLIYLFSIYWLRIIDPVEWNKIIRIPGEFKSYFIRNFQFKNV